MDKRAHPAHRTHVRIALLLTILLSLLAPLRSGASPTAQSNKWFADYFANTTLSGSPVLTRFDDVNGITQARPRPYLDSGIAFNWGIGSPAPEVPADGFSARWTREEWFENGTYRFFFWSDDGVRVWLDDELIIDDWQDQQRAWPWKTRDVFAPGGIHRVRVEYYENTGGAELFVGWRRITGEWGWIGEYYRNQDLAGYPAVMLFNRAIDFDWYWGSPSNYYGIPQDHFSVRWKTNLGFSAGTYRFFTSTDDGVRLWVDGQLVIDAWIKQKLPNTHTGDITLGEGTHDIKVEYFEEGGLAHAHVWWKRLDEFTGWQGEYFDNRYLVGGPALARDDAEIDFDWGDGPPTSWMPHDNFSARWSRELTFEEGYYRFSVQSDDGARVWLDDGLIIDKWQEMDNELHYVDGIFLSGPHRLKVEYYERTGFARIHFWISPASTTPTTPIPQGRWQGSYFANDTLEGDPTLVREDAAIDFDWKLGAPDPALPSDHFSVRWQTSQGFEAGRYRFNTYTDDGVRLLVDGQPVIESWRPMRGYRSATVDLTAGPHTLVLEYFERTQAALARLSWTRVGTGAATAPTPSSGTSGTWQIEYFDNPDLSGTPLLTQTQDDLDFDCGFGAPAPGMPSDDFSVRCTTRQSFDSGSYTFTTYSDDGVRLFVDGVRVIDSWRPMRGYRSVFLDLSAGEHTIILEYFERGGIALVRLSWQP